MNKTCPLLLVSQAGERLKLIADSYRRLTGRALIADGSDSESALWSLPQVVLAHGTESDPVFFYGNRMALELFELTPDQITRMPSRLSAEPLQREAREKLLQRVAQHGFIDDYEGIRVSSTGKRFRIKQATVWNLIDEHGLAHGQAATFGEWEIL
ncbi:MAG: MEKHLA domain-containing protein [Pseudohongiella sp.]|nr:MEKHLA domain-containing protein [Pseudohongiella sp.]MDO9518910.1 MEKHLA domain-containing protein [Pseudohongiella sp.]MDP2126431.1 MEKHLA domain-containing protein [Pseudohongiella sp.]